MATGRRKTADPKGVSPKQIARRDTPGHERGEALHRPAGAAGRRRPRSPGNQAKQVLSTKSSNLNVTSSITQTV